MDGELVGLVGLSLPAALVAEADCAVGFCGARLDSEVVHATDTDHHWGCIVLDVVLGDCECAIGHLFVVNPLVASGWIAGHLQSNRVVPLDEDTARLEHGLLDLIQLMEHNRGHRVIFFFNQFDKILGVLHSTGGQKCARESEYGESRWHIARWRD